MTKNAACAVLALLLTACGTVSGPQIVKVVVPVPCRAELPDRPLMPTESLRPGAGIDAFVQAAQAEIERREGYEETLRAGLEGCIAPLPQETPAMPAGTPTAREVA